MTVRAGGGQGRIVKAVFLTGVLLLLAVVDGEPAAGQETEPVVGSPGLELSSMMASGHWELRIYTINRGQLDEFVAAWLAGPYRIRTEHGFGIPAAWISRENNQFIWIVGYDGPESWDEKQAAYYSSAARTSVEVDPLTMIAHGDTWPITPVQ